jgi:hypothetical protein
MADQTISSPSIELKSSPVVEDNNSSIYSKENENANEYFIQNNKIIKNYLYFENVANKPSFYTLVLTGLIILLIIYITFNTKSV